MIIYRIGIRVVGVTFEGRDTIIKILGKSPKLSLERLPNIHDQYAISVVSEKGVIGFVPKEIAYILRDVEPLTVLSTEASRTSSTTPQVKLIFSASLSHQKAVQISQYRQKLTDWTIINYVP